MPKGPLYVYPSDHQKAVLKAQPNEPLWAPLARAAFWRYLEELKALGQLLCLMLPMEQQSAPLLVVVWMLLPRELWFHFPGPAL